jgi:hypothetical protein
MLPHVADVDVGGVEDAGGLEVEAVAAAIAIRNRDRTLALRRAYIIGEEREYRNKWYSSAAGNWRYSGIKYKLVAGERHFSF